MQLIGGLWQLDIALPVLASLWTGHGTVRAHGRDQGTNLFCTHKEHGRTIARTPRMQEEQFQMALRSFKKPMMTSSCGDTAGLYT